MGSETVDAPCVIKGTKQKPMDKSASVRTFIDRFPRMGSKHDMRAALRLLRNRTQNSLGSFQSFKPCPASRRGQVAWLRMNTNLGPLKTRSSYSCDQQTYRATS